MIPHPGQRLEIYKRLSRADTVDEIRAIMEETEDRFGRLAESARNLFRQAELRVLAQEQGAVSIDWAGDAVAVRYGGRPKVDGERVIRLAAARRPGADDRRGGAAPQGDRPARRSDRRGVARAAEARVVSGPGQVIAGRTVQRAMLRAARPASLALALALTLAAGCDRKEEPAPATAPASRSATLSEAQLDRFLLRETGLDPRTIDPAARVRLREELVAEALFADAAEARGLYAPIEAIDDATRRLTALGADGTPQELREDARRRVLAQIYETTVLMPEVRDDARSSRAGDLAACRPGRSGHLPPAAGRQPRQGRGGAPAPRARPGDLPGRRGQVSQAPDRGAIQTRALTQLPSRRPGC